MTMGQNPVPPVNIPLPTKIGSKVGGAPIPKWDPIGVDPQSNAKGSPQKARLPVWSEHPADH